MVLLKVLSGNAAGREFTARRLPFSIGRAPDAGLSLTDDGVWERHCRISLQPGGGLMITSDQDAVTLVNDERVRETRLRNGDTIQLGAATLQFWLSQPRQTGLRLREALTWLAVFALAGLQVAAFHWLTR